MKSTFRTSDITLATFLKVSGIELLSVSPVGRVKSSFVFQNTNKRQTLGLDFFNHRERVDPLEFVSVLKSLRGFTNEMKSNHDMRVNHAEPDRTG